MAADYDIWVDFHKIDQQGRIVVHADNATPGTDLSAGATVVLGDNDGHTARATVVRAEPTQLTLQVDMSSVEIQWEAGEQ